MIGAIRGWLLSIAAVTLFLTLVQLLTPEGTLRKIAGFTGGLLLLTALLRPLGQIDFGWLGLELSDYSEMIEEQTAELTRQEKETLAGRIAEQTAAYISDKADALGLGNVTAQVKTAPGADGETPIPDSAELTGPYSQALADWIAGELGIPAERQVWHEGKN